MHIVDALKVEHWVNEAKCPTRVELSVATKNQGLREGFKWLVKSIIAHLPELGPRVELDVEEERLKEEIRRADVRKRMEEKRRRQNDEIEEEEEEELPGFVPIEKYNSTMSRELLKVPSQPKLGQDEDSHDEKEENEVVLSLNPSIRVFGSSITEQRTPTPPPQPTPLSVSPTNASPPIPPPPPLPGPNGPPPQPAPAGSSNQSSSKSSKSSSPDIVKSNGRAILPTISPFQLPQILSLPAPVVQNGFFTDTSPRTPLPPTESPLPSPFLQLSLNGRSLPARSLNIDHSKDIQFTGEELNRVIIGRESIDSEIDINLDGNLNRVGSNDTSNVFQLKRNSLTGSLASQGNGNTRNSSASSSGTRKLELEPINRVKKKSALKKVVNNNYKTTNPSSKSNPGATSGGHKPSLSKPGSRAGSSYNRRGSIVFKPIVNW